MDVMDVVVIPRVLVAVNWDGKPGTMLFLYL